MVFKTAQKKWIQRIGLRLLSLVADDVKFTNGEQTIESNNMSTA